MDSKPKRSRNIVPQTVSTDSESLGEIEVVYATGVTESISVSSFLQDVEKYEKNLSVSKLFLINNKIVFRPLHVTITYTNKSRCVKSAAELEESERLSNMFSIPANINFENLRNTLCQIKNYVKTLSIYITEERNMSREIDNGLYETYISCAVYVVNGVEYTKLQFIHPKITVNNCICDYIANDIKDIYEKSKLYSAETMEVFVPTFNDNIAISPYPDKQTELYPCYNPVYVAMVNDELRYIEKPVLDVRCFANMYKVHNMDTIHDINDFGLILTLPYTYHETVNNNIANSSINIIKGINDKFEIKVETMLLWVNEDRYTKIDCLVKICCIVWRHLTNTVIEDVSIYEVTKEDIRSIKEFILKHAFNMNINIETLDEALVLFAKTKNKYNNYYVYRSYTYVTLLQWISYDKPKIYASVLSQRAYTTFSAIEKKENDQSLARFIMSVNPYMIRIGDNIYRFTGNINTGIESANDLKSLFVDSMEADGSTSSKLAFTSALNNMTEMYKNRLNKNGNDEVAMTKMKLINDIKTNLNSHRKQSDLSKTIFGTIPKSPESMNKKENMTVVKNGVLEIFGETIIFRQSLLEDLKTEHMDVNCDLNLIGCGDNPPIMQELMKTLLNWVGEDQLDFLKRFAASLLEPGNQHKTLVVFYGPGNTGKSTCVSLFQKLLGNNGMCANINSNFLFTGGKVTTGSADPETHTAKLARLAAIGELSSLCALDSAKIKSVTGNEDPIATRRLYDNNISVAPFIAKVLIAANNIPALDRPSDTAAINRFSIVLFENNQLLKETKENIALKINELRPALLALMINTWPYYLKKNLEATPKMRENRLKWMSSQSKYAEYLQKNVRPKVDGFVTTDDIIRGYRTYVKDIKNENDVIANFSVFMNNYVSGHPVSPLNHNISITANKLFITLEDYKNNAGSIDDCKKYKINVVTTGGTNYYFLFDPELNSNVYRVDTLDDLIVLENGWKGYELVNLRQ